MSDTIHWTDRLWEEIQAAQRWSEKMHDRFICDLTSRQLDAWEAMGRVPKSEKHQRNFKRYQDACHEYDCLMRRWKFEIIEGEAI